MRTISLFVVFFGASFAALANGGSHLTLSAAELDRLGVEFEAAQAVARAGIASGPAEVVIPPAQQAIVSTTVSGVLSRLFVAEGDAVGAGETVAEIESADLLGLQREFVNFAAAADLARSQLERDRGLYADGIIAERRVQETTVAARAATTVLEQVRQQLQLAGMSAPQIDRLGETRELSPTLQLHAPFNSIVVERLSALGQRVDALDPVFRIADLSRLWLEVHVSQEEVARIEPGMRVTVSTGDQVLDAEITHVGQVVDPASQTVLVRAGVDNAGLPLRAGQFLPAQILTSAAGYGVIVAVPSAAVVRSGDVAAVFVRSAAGLMAQPVEILAEDAMQTYVTAGIDPGMEVAVAGVATLKSVWTAGQAEGD